MKKALIIVVIIGVIVTGFFLVRKYSGASGANFKETINDEGFNISTGGGTISGKYEDANTLNLGLRVYPGATSAGDSKSAGNYNLNGVKLSAATYQTDDSREKVEKFYSNLFGSDLQKGEVISGDKTYKIFKSKTNSDSALVNVWVENNATYFTIFKAN